GVLAQTVDQVAVTYNTVYLSAAGNWADHAWQSSWRGVQASLPGLFGTVMDFDPGSGVDPLQNFTLAPGQTLDLALQWDSAFLEGGSDQPNFQVKNDLDVYITDANGVPLRQFGDNNLNTGEALERVVFTNDGSFGTNQFGLAIVLKQGSEPNLLKWIRFDN